MMNHIDISTVLRQTLSCDLYSNLVTRPTGAAVRGQIEQLLGDGRGGPSEDDVLLTVIDFSHVAMIDFSCADEVIAKLLLPYVEQEAPGGGETYFVFRGVSDDHRDAIETVLERHDLALVVEDADGVHVMGVISDDEQRAWDAVYRLRGANAAEVAAMLAADPVDVARVMHALWRRRLLIHVDGRYVAVGQGGRRDE
jgi:hypothetical protein